MTRETLRRLELDMLARSLGWGGGIASQIKTLSYRRRAEEAADASAIETLRRAGLRADGLGRFFTSLQNESGGNDLPAFLSDHPSMASRTDVLRCGSRPPARRPSPPRNGQARRPCAQPRCHAEDIT